MPKISEEERWKLWLVTLLAQVKSDLKKISIPYMRDEFRGHLLFEEIDGVLKGLEDQLPSPRDKKSAKNKDSQYYIKSITDLHNELEKLMDTIRWHHMELQKKDPSFQDLKSKYLETNEISEGFIRSLLKKHAGRMQYTDSPYFNGRRFVLFKLEKFNDDLNSAIERKSPPEDFLMNTSLVELSSSQGDLGVALSPSRNRASTSLSSSGQMFESTREGLRRTRAKTLPTIPKLARSKSNPDIPSPREAATSRDDSRHSVQFDSAPGSDTETSLKNSPVSARRRSTIKK